MLVHIILLIEKFILVSIVKLVNLDKKSTLKFRVFGTRKRKEKSIAKTKS